MSLPKLLLVNGWGWGFMDIRVLEYYLIVAREESITKAAAILHVTQPTLSRQLMQLEEELQVKLFNRTSHSVVLTEDGLLFKRRAQEIVALSEKTKRDFIRGNRELSGEIGIGCGEFRSIQIIAQIMKEFKKEHPFVTFQIYSGNSSNIKERIESGILDIGVILDYVDIRKYEYVRIPLSEEWGVLVREDSPLAAMEYVTPEDIRELPLIISERSMRDNELADWIGKKYEDLNIVSTYNLMYNAAIMVANGMGVAGCIKLDCRYEGTRFVPARPSVKNNSVFAWKKALSQSQAVSSFIEFSRIYIKRISSNTT
ncbi:LysR family transcriptional regulator [Enterocloster bolteae 90B8]|nr:LysR family transcriptional regulator [Enterocloster bolteae 90B8]